MKRMTSVSVLMLVALVWAALPAGGLKAQAGIHPTAGQVALQAAPAIGGRTFGGAMGHAGAVPPLQQIRERSRALPQTAASLQRLGAGAISPSSNPSHGILSARTPPNCCG